jgi:hypothetical protein
MATKAIPFTQEDRATIRSTSRWMLIAGAIMTVSGGFLLYRMLDAFGQFGALILRVLPIPVIVTGGLLGLGLLLVFASFRFARVADHGEVAALSGGLAILTIIYVIQAIFMILTIAVVVLGLLAPMFMR